MTPPRSIDRTTDNAGLPTWQVSARGHPTWIGWILIGGLVWIVLIGGTRAGDVEPTLRLVNGLVGALVVIGLFFQFREAPDTGDRSLATALALFALAAVLSAHPRQSLDAVTSALSYTAAMLLARSAARSEPIRRRFGLVLVALSAAITLFAVSVWLVPVIEWAQTTGWRIVPAPSSFALSGFQWGHPHDLSLLLVLLYPAWWLGKPNRVRQACAIAVGVLIAMLALIDGSRTVWIAAVVASIATGGGLLASKWRRSFLVPAVLICSVAVGLAVASGLGATVIERAVSVASLEARGAMWSSVIGDWAAHPLQGEGPGSFPWVLQVTGYFNNNSWAPRHPDSVIIQAVAEGGLIGIGVVLVLTAALLRAAIHGRSRAARWSLIVFMACGVTASPTDFPFLIVVAMGWAAYTSPRGESVATTRPLAFRFAAFPAAGLAVVAIAYALTTSAAYFYALAREDVLKGALWTASTHLDAAISLDPSMALYHRQRGTVNILRSRHEAATTDLRRAVHLNPADDVAWRSLAVAYLGSGNGAAASEALAMAAATRRSDPANLLLGAKIATRDGRTSQAMAFLAEIVQSWPSTVFSTRWVDVVPDTFTTADVIEVAVNRWVTNQPALAPAVDQGIWLAAMAGRKDLSAMAIESSVWAPAMANALNLAVGCQLTQGDLDRLPVAQQRNYLYWWLRARHATLHDRSDTTAIRMSRLMGHPIDRWDVSEINPLNEDGGFSADRWGYRRLAISWPAAATSLPSPTAGLARWLREPRAAAASAALDDALHACLPEG